MLVGWLMPERLESLQCFHAQSLPYKMLLAAGFHSLYPPPQLAPSIMPILLSSFIASEFCGETGRRSPGASLSFVAELVTVAQFPLSLACSALMVAVRLRGFRLTDESLDGSAGA